MQPEQINSFLEKFAAGNHTEEDHQQFVDWLKVAPMGEVEKLVNEFTIHESGVANPELISKIEAALDQHSSHKVIYFPKFWKLVIAVSIIFLLGVGYF